MNWNTVSFEKLLQVTAEDLAAIKNNLGIVYGDETIPTEVRLATLANAFNTIDSWSNYFNKFKDILDHKVEELNTENTQLKFENKLLKQQLSSIKDTSTETAVLKERIKYLEEVISIKDNSSNIVSIDLVDRLDSLDEAIKIIKDNAKTIAYKGNLKDFKPAKRIDISDDDIRDKYLAGETAYKIAKDCGLTAGAIVYRLKQMGIYKRKE